MKFASVKPEFLHLKYEKSSICVKSKKKYRKHKTIFRGFISHKIYFTFTIKKFILYTSCLFLFPFGHCQSFLQRSLQTFFPIVVF